MKIIAIISFLILTSGYAAFSQEKQNSDTKERNMAVAEKGLIKVTVMYPYAEGKKFDIGYYETKHMPMVAGFLGSNLVKYTIEKGLANGMPNQPLPFAAIGTFYIRNLKDYQSAVGPHRDAIRADFANYTDIVPTILVSEVVR
ncbi:EthD family reductase [Mucilaginibacter terrenus]|uniref:EthD family reductase n=1 Tax=Mucilaginibacter terrenus TaxID=2482727 RepID=A0A3E2NTR5_9SPHI|nr:EthD family reductase [Mucilaginibacter terrenus]RFZ84403.1 EthD family reductase [Mucilaginibacter terrenus]